MSPLLCLFLIYIPLTDLSMLLPFVFLCVMFLPFPYLKIYKRFRNNPSYLG